MDILRMYSLIILNSFLCFLNDAAEYIAQEIRFLFVNTSLCYHTR